ncbi:hypothetical protein KR200_001535 [Drosophila serrata]|nr:hypothetical protein KR200_001535 [Drosophila serrata]
MQSPKIMVARPRFVEKATQIDAEKGISFENKFFSWDTAEDVQTVADLIKRQETVHFLNLGGNRLGVKAAKAIGRALRYHPELRKAQWQDLFGPDLAKKIPNMLIYLGLGLKDAGANLTYLDLSNNALGPKGLGGLVHMLNSPVCYSLQELHLRKCKLGPEGAIILSNSFINLHGKAKEFKLKHFDGGANRFNNVGAKALAKAFKLLQTLEGISLENNSISFRGVKALAKSFTKNPNLRRLNLNDNCLRSQGTAEIAEILPCLAQLRELEMGNCRLSTIGALLIAKALDNSVDLVEITNFSSNQIYVAGGRALVDAMKKKPNLRIVNLADNCFKPEQIINFVSQDRKSSIITFNSNGSNPVDSSDNLDDENRSGEDSGEEDYGVTGSRELLQQLIMESLKWANLCMESDEALEMTISMLQNTVHYAEISNQNASVVNCLLTEMHQRITGVSRQNKYNIEAGQYALRQAICRPEFANDDIKEIIKWYLKKIDQEKNSKSVENVPSMELSDNDITEENIGPMCCERLQLLITGTLLCSKFAENSKDALEAVVSLLKTLFKYAEITNQQAIVVNIFLMELNQKVSDEPLKTKYNIKAAQLALREVISHPGFVNDGIKNQLEKYLKNVDKKN